MPTPTPPPPPPTHTRTHTPYYACAIMWLLSYLACVRYLRDFFMGILSGTVTLTFVNQPLLLYQNYGFCFKEVFCVAYTPVIFPLFNFYFYVFF